ncbi:hypothetical protein BTM25_45910 [Actinomadura rubteroloni]|uniref:Lipoprotein n=1 Tax=Actinomadura rubteroloni TaxID=1926885 RepID=A0A2P4UEJ9_9ACTN|nr:hypothetical protein [Actinomadura rubteroloni]POM23438.1 hypothetical protein BTM25_45910 [Actinomadura rubteroloni]
MVTLRRAAVAALVLVPLSCGTSPARGDGTVRSGAEFQLAPGGSVRVADGATTLRFDRVSADSRCPEGVQCVWEGDATVVLTATERGRAARTFELHTAAEPSAATVGAHRVRLTGLVPGKPSGGRIAPGAYRVRLRLD